MATKSIYVKTQDLESWHSLEAHIKQNNQDKRKTQLALGQMLTDMIKEWLKNQPKQEKEATQSQDHHIEN